MKPKMVSRDSRKLSTVKTQPTAKNIRANCEQEDFGMGIINLHKVFMGIRFPSHQNEYSIAIGQGYELFLGKKEHYLQLEPSIRN